MRNLEKRYLCLPSCSELDNHRNVDLVCPLEVGSWHGQLIAVEVEEVLQVIAEGRSEICRLAHQIDDWILTSERNHLNLFLECWWECVNLEYTTLGLPKSSWVSCLKLHSINWVKPWSHTNFELNLGPEKNFHTGKCDFKSKNIKLQGPGGTLSWP